jgi:hypothetical protein
MNRNDQAMAEGKKFKTYHRIWVETSGQYQACEWMAVTIGQLVSNVGHLQKQLRKLEKRITKTT